MTPETIRETWIDDNLPEGAPRWTDETPAHYADLRNGDLMPDDEPGSGAAWGWVFVAVIVFWATVLLVGLSYALPALVGLIADAVQCYNCDL